MRRSLWLVKKKSTIKLLFAYRSRGQTATAKRALTAIVRDPICLERRWRARLTREQTRRRVFVKPSGQSGGSLGSTWVLYNEKFNLKRWNSARTASRRERDSTS